MESLMGRTFENNTSGERGLDGYWKVTVTVVEKITYDGENWEKEEISAVGIDKTFDAAQKTALRSVLQWLEEYVYSRGFDNLVLAVKHNKELEAKNGTEVNLN